MTLAGHQNSDTKMLPSRKSVLLFLQYIPFFMPMGISYMRETSSVASALYIAFMGAQVLVSVIVLINGIKRTVIDYSILSVGILCGLMVLSSVLSGGSKLQSALFDCLTFLGLACLLKNSFEADSRRAITVLTVIFLALTLGSFASVFLTGGQGFVSGKSVATRTFLFGGKNSLFLFGIPAVASLSMLCMMRSKTLGSTPFALSLLYCLTAFYIQSSSSMLCFGALAILLFFIRNSCTIGFRHYPYVYFSIIVIVLFVLVMFQNTTGLEQLFVFVDREATFSGRTFVWNQALDYIKASPVFGNGSDLTFYVYGLQSWSAGHAHCYYLDSAAKYGLIYIAVFTIDILYVIRSHFRYSRRAYVCISLSVFFLLLFHSLFDYMGLEFYILLRAFCLYVNPVVFGFSEDAAEGDAVRQKNHLTKIPGSLPLSGVDSSRRFGLTPMSSNNNALGQK